MVLAGVTYKDARDIHLWPDESKIERLLYVQVASTLKVG